MTTQPDGPLPFPADEPPADPGALTRRHFLAGLTGIGAAAALTGCATGSPVRAATAGTARPPSTTPGRTASADRAGAAVRAAGGILVVLTLYGGNDGLDTVIPAHDPAYRSARGALARDPSKVLDLGDGLGFHPGLTRLKRQWDAKRIAVVRGVGFDDLDRSHFHCMDMWQSAGGDHMASGWLGRWLDHAGHDPLRAVAIGPSLPLLMQGTKAAGSLVPVGPLAIPGGDRLAGLFRELSIVDPAASPLARAASVAGADMLTVVAKVSAATAASSASADPVDGAGAAQAGGDAGGGGAAGGLAAQLGVVGRMIEAGLPTRAYAVSMGGFDTHSNEPGTRDRLMAELDSGLGGFLERIGQRPVTVLAYSEFGRRVEVNGSGGTDHGTAGPVFVCGPAVKGGFYGEEPSLTRLDDGDLRHTVDFRSVYTTVLGGVLDAEPDIAVDDASRYRPLPLLA